MSKINVSVAQSYQNPFERSSDFARALTSQTKTGKTVQIAGAIDPDKVGLVKRKWRLDMDKAVRANIEGGRESWKAMTNLCSSFPHFLTHLHLPQRLGRGGRTAKNKLEVELPHA